MVRIVQFDIECDVNNGGGCNVTSAKVEELRKALCDAAERELSKGGIVVNKVSGTAKYSYVQFKHEDIDR